MEILKNNIETTFLKQWADHFKEPVVLVLGTGEILFSNKAAIGLFGIKETASSVSDNVPYFFLSEAKEEWQRILNAIHTQKEYYVQCPFSHAEHGNLYLDIKCNALNHTHEVCYIFQIITIKDGHEESPGLFERDQDIFAGILRNTNEAVFFVEQYTRKIIDCNKRAVELFEAENKEELIGLKGPDLHCYPMSEEDRARASREEELPNGWDWELLYKTRKNRKFWGRINVLKLTIDHKFLLLVRITDIDIEKKALEKLIQSEKKYRDLITYNQALICTHDMNGVIISANPACEQALEVEEKNLIGKTIGTLFDKSRLAEYHQYLRKINEEDQVSGIMEVLNSRGHKMYWLYHNYKVTEEGEEPYVVGSAKDITERMRMEKELIQAKIQAISSLKARELFLANVSHEIRTPMNGIIGVLELMNKTSLNDLQAKYSKIIQNSSERLLVIINDILDYAKIESGTITMENVPFDIVEASKSVIQPLLLNGIDKRNELYVNLETPSCILVLGDPYRYGQVIINLINNAIKFTSNGEISVVGKVLSETDQNVEYQITVKDTGIGISKEDMGKIFDEFTQAHISNTRKYGGTGLGLSICKKLVEMQGGKLNVFSEPDNGSEFIITYNFVNAKDARIDKVREAKVDPAAIQGLYMLLVEDNEINQYVVKTIAELNGIKIDIADTGVKGIAMIRKNTYDLVLMDIQMPDMDGIETTAIIRNKLSSSVPIIAYTANAMKGDLEKYIENGMNDYLSKPLKEEELLNKIGNVLKLPFIKADAGVIKEEVEMYTGDSLYSTEYLKTLGNNRPEFINAMLIAFVNTIPKELEKLTIAFDNGDLNRIKEIVHKIKSSAKTLMITSLEENIKFMEQYTGNVFNEEYVSAYHYFTETIQKVLLQVQTDV